MKEFIKSLFNIDEEKNSILIYILIGFSLLLGYKAFRYGDISDNLLNLVEFLIGTVAAINVSKQVTNSINKSSGGDNNNDTK